MFMENAPPTRPSESEALRRLLAPLLEALGYAGDDARRKLDDIMSALPVTVNVLDVCSAGNRSRDIEVLACLLAASVRGHGRMDSSRLHELLALCETLARLLSFVEEEQGAVTRPRGKP
jgi:hypothetical protein